MTTRRELHQAIDQMSDEEVRQVITVVERLLTKPSDAVDPIRERLKSSPGIELPAHWPPQFEEFEPLRIDGEPVSEQLIRERR